MTDDHAREIRDGMSPEEEQEAHDPAIGTGTPDTAPHEAPPTTIVERQPVRVIGAASAIAASATTIIALDVPIWAGLLLGVGLYVIEEYKRSKVTPAAVPRDDAGEPLTP